MARMTNEQRRKRAKQTATLRSRGVFTDVPNDAAVAHLVSLHARGMTIEQIAMVAGMSNGTVHSHIRGVRNKISRRNHALIMAIKFQPPLARGGYIEALPTRRRLGALGASGFPLTWLVPQLGVSHTTLMRIYRDQPYVFVDTARVVAEAYEKYADKDPQDYDITKNASGVASFYARKHGHAPFMCWDSDTLDDPDAFPEWTGQCGTDNGARLHYERGILPVCEPCSLARQEARRVRRDA